MYAYKEGCLLQEAAQFQPTNTKLQHNLSTQTEAVIKPALKYFDHFWSPRTLQILVAICAPAKVRGVSLSGVFSWAALSPAQSFLFVFLHENK